jgi:hypothetical protein
MVMLQKPFEAGSFLSDDASALIVEVGETHCMMSLVNAEKMVLAVQVYTFDAESRESSVDEILKLFPDSSSFEKVVIAAAFVETLLVPRRHHPHREWLLMHSTSLNGFEPLTDAIAELQIENAFGFPGALRQHFINRFPHAQFMHVYTPLLKVYNGVSSDEQLMVHFMYQQFTVVLKQQQQIQLAQTYQYTSPMDVVYYLLKISSEFGLSVEEVPVIISGFVSEDSALYKELHQYFFKIQFSKNSKNSFGGDFPDHFFTSVYNIAACAL